MSLIAEKDDTTLLEDPEEQVLIDIIESNLSKEME